MESPANAARFVRATRLRRRADYLAVQERGRRVSGPHYLLLARRRSPDESGLAPRARFGITVSRKVGNAVKRNQVKRWLRESYRRLQREAPARVDLVVIARPAAATSGYATTLGELSELLRKLGR